VRDFPARAFRRAGYRVAVEAHRVLDAQKVDSEGLLVQLAKIQKIVIYGNLHDAHFLPRAGGGRFGQSVGGSRSTNAITDLAAKNCVGFELGASDEERSCCGSFILNV
jgi:hypothetical protein